MKNKLAEGYHARYAVVSPRAHVDFPFGWIPSVGDMLQRLSELPSEIRDYIVVTGIDVDPVTGLLDVVVGANTERMPDGGMTLVDTIVKDTRTLLAWTCETEGEEGWLVHRKGGVAILCPQCQRSGGIMVVQHGA